MKIGFFADNRQLPTADFRYPEEGSPGVGASLYTQVAVPFFIKKYLPEKAEVLIFAPSIEHMPSNIECVKADSIISAAQLAKDADVDYFVFRARLNDDEGILNFIDSISLPSIGVGQLTLFPKTIRQMSRSKHFKSLVCVGREQYDSLIDSPLKTKLGYIDNAVHLKSCWSNSTSEEKDPRLVVYMGAMVPVKGFHQLAEAWPKVLNEFPDAKLSVIGSVKIYREGLSVGPLGVASKDYERNQIMPHLCDDQGNLHPSVTFHGQMGQEKFDVIRKATIGVVNPSGQSETCCVSAIEMSACKVPVVTGAYYALLDTILHKKTGLLGRGNDDLAKNICALLSDIAYAERLGNTGFQRVKNQFDFFAIVPRWIALFEALDARRMPQPYGTLKNIRYHYKALRILNSILQHSIGKIIPWPTVLELQVWAHKCLRNIKTLKEKSFLKSKTT